MPLSVASAALVSGVGGATLYAPLLLCAIVGLGGLLYLKPNVETWYDEDLGEAVPPGLPGPAAGHRRRYNFLDRAVCGPQAKLGLVGFLLYWFYFRGLELGDGPDDNDVVKHAHAPN